MASKNPGPALKAAREQRGKTAASVAAEIGVPRSTFSNWENDDRDVPYEQLEPWGRALGLRVEVILRPEDGSPELREEDLTPAQRQVLKSLLRALPSLDDQRAQVIAGVLDMASARAKPN